MVEGSSNVSLEKIEFNVKKLMSYCSEAPFYVLGPLVADIAPGYDHITSAIGASMAVGMVPVQRYPATSSPKSMGFPNAEDVVRVDCIKIAAHAADITRYRPGVRDRDDELSRPRLCFLLIRTGPGSTTMTCCQQLSSSRQSSFLCVD